MALQVQTRVYVRGYNNKACPKYVVKSSLLHKDYLKGKQGRKKNVILKIKNNGS